MAIALKAQAAPGYELRFVAHALSVEAVHALHQARVRRICDRDRTSPVAHVALEPYIGVRRCANRYNAIKRAYEQDVLQRSFGVLSIVGWSATIATILAGVVRHDAWFILWALLTLPLQFVVVVGLQMLGECVVAPLLWMRRPKARIAYHLEKVSKT